MSFLQNDNFSLSIPITPDGKSHIMFPVSYHLNPKYMWSVRLIDLFLPELLLLTEQDFIFNIKILIEEKIGVIKLKTSVDYKEINQKITSPFEYINYFYEILLRDFSQIYTKNNLKLIYLSSYSFLFKTDNTPFFIIDFNKTVIQNKNIGLLFSTNVFESNVVYFINPKALLCYIVNTSNLIHPSFVTGKPENVLDLISYSPNNHIQGLDKHGISHQVINNVIPQISFEFFNGFFEQIKFISSLGKIKILFEKHIVHRTMDPGFYVYLPSNVPDQTGRNTTRSYKTFLNPIIHLSKNFIWDIGVASFFYVNSITNITQTQYFDILFYGSSTNKLSSVRCVLSSGDYTTGEKLTEALVQVLNNTKYNNVKLSEIIDVVYSEVSRKIFFFTKESIESSKSSSSISITFLTEELPSLLGIEAGEIHPLPVHTKYSLDFHPKFHAIYLYSDISAFQNIGNVQAPILASFGVKGQSGELICERPQNVAYARVLNYDINSIHISLNTETGEPVPFESGFAQVVLHFRPRV